MSETEKGGFISKVIGPKRRWREYKARVKQLPEDYRAAVDAIERYLMHFVPADGDSAVSDLSSRILRICSNVPRRTEHRSARSSATTPWSSSRRLLRTTRRAGMSPTARGNS